MSDTNNGNLLVYNIGCLATPLGNFAKKGKDHGNILLTHNCYVLIQNGIIAKVGTHDDTHGSIQTINKKLPDNVLSVDANGKLVTPGFVDCHTHLVFGGWRHKEFPLKLAGVPYLDILKQGGGILNTVESTRSASFDELYAKAYSLLDECIQNGITTLEAKSGYGLDVETEIKCLEVSNKLNKKHPVDVVSTYMGAHAMPKEHTDNRRAYIDLIIRKVLPLVSERGLAEFCDVFCENSAFTVEESTEILAAAKSFGLGLKIHADELSDLGGGRVAAELGCISAEHLIKISDDSVEAIAASDTIAVCLPCTSFYLNEDFAPAKKIIGSGGSIALATDFNPGSTPNLNMLLAVCTACYKYRLSPAEALTAATLNAAAAIGRGESVGSVEVGKKGDLVVWNADCLPYLFYRYGSNMTHAVVKSGNMVIQNSGRLA